MTTPTTTGPGAHLRRAYCGLADGAEQVRCVCVNLQSKRLEQMDKAMLEAEYNPLGWAVYDNPVSGRLGFMYYLINGAALLAAVGVTPDPQPTHGTPWPWPWQTPPASEPIGAHFRLGVDELEDKTTALKNALDVETALDLEAMTPAEVNQSWGRIAGLIWSDWLPTWDQYQTPKLPSVTVHGLNRELELHPAVPPTLPVPPAPALPL